MSSPHLIEFQREQQNLLAVAFRILGSESDAEDVVQEAWIRFSAAEQDELRNPAAWLTTVVTRLCLDVLRKRRAEPKEPTELTLIAGDSGPEEVALLAGELVDAFTVVLETLTPPQRVALILHDSFGVSFDEVGRILSTTPGSAKKLASRARARVREAADFSRTDPARTREVVSRFVKAAQEGDVEGLVRVLHPDVERIADPQIVPAGAAKVIRGARAVAAGAASATRALGSGDRAARIVMVDGEPGAEITEGQERVAVIVFVVAGDLIRYIEIIADPRRLARLHIAG